MRPLRLCTAILTLLIVSAGAYAAEDAPTNPFLLPGNWYRANFHAHSTASDGDVELPVRVEQYRNAGYSILAITDHEKTSDVTPFCTPDFLLISGMETHPQSPILGMAYHFVCLNVPQGLAFEKSVPVQDRLRAVADAGGYIIAAHPYWCGFSIEELLPLREYGVNAIEVYNATCRFNGRANSSVHWDELLGKGWRIPAVAVDDVHDDDSLFKGWTMVKAEALTLDSVMAALRAGAYYATTGPEFTDIRVEEGVLKVACSPVVRIQFYANAPNGRQFLAKDTPLTAAEFKPGDRVRYVRVEITDANGNSAWSPQFFFP